MKCCYCVRKKMKVVMYGCVGLCLASRIRRGCKAGFRLFCRLIWSVVVVDSW